MRVVVGSESPRDGRSAELDRHITMMARFVERVERGRREAPALTMIVRSAQSAPALAFIAMSDELARAGASAKVVLARLEPEADMRQLYASLCRLAPRGPAEELIRWARNPRLLEAHEQVTYGTAMCWSGDAMRRDADRRNALTLFDEAAPQTARLGRLAFEALWAASSRCPSGASSGPAAARPSGAYQVAAESRRRRLAAPSKPPGLAARPALGQSPKFTSLPGLTRQSIPLAPRLVGRNGMDARIKSGHDGVSGAMPPQPCRRCCSMGRASRSACRAARAQTGAAPAAAQGRGLRGLPHRFAHRRRRAEPSQAAARARA